jgi:hypothetical protein
MSKIECDKNHDEFLKEQKRQNEQCQERIFELMFGQPPNIFFEDPNLGKDPDTRDFEVLKKAFESLQGSLPGIFPEDQFINLSLKNILESQRGEFLELLTKNIVSEKRALAKSCSDELKGDPISFIGYVFTKYCLLSNEISKEDYKKEFGVEPEDYTPDEKQMRLAIEAHVAKAVQEKASLQLNREEVDPVLKYIKEKYGALLEEFPMGFSSLRSFKDNRIP